MAKRGFFKVLAFLTLVAFYPEDLSLALLHGVARLRCSLSAARARLSGRFIRLGATRVLFWEL